ncbi:dipeptide/oligopeptide/nickel ABC transporter permease/ATP-binding protein [Propioniciclava coleopterorum]|uniref:Dipeptide/oligopeptide/nickel ABC transporter permease/ATP-binding protein n=1 Tax=Propioniciclava coleopterorum TaxID=2714937 RepID=A0A6G7Y6S5_9ACTN|nr:dipeptide/oligopeptide/nickel ABC transporter permease/ATP-binding protein [Propioniciclava coleopterorum]QIK72348.1 dipeptide/oligopeptide/nickel ABC transporter permease/ATP-binding protein [Propioniciclava coleopterorum]
MRRTLTEKLSRPGLRLGALPLGSRIALIVFGVVVLGALFAPLVTVNPLASGVPALPPSAEHWFGTDALGRDVFSRVLNGARNSLVIGLAATAVALVAAAILGSIAATAGKWVSEVLMRILDIVMSFPGIALAAVFVAGWGNSIPVLVLAIAFLYTPQLTRVVRANVLAQFGEDYVSASRVMGASTPWILARHVARNCIAPILVFATVLVADAIVFEASLSFINAGVKPPNPSWGNVLAEGKQLLLIGGWWATFFPGLAILITTLSLNVLSEGMTDAMVAPRARKVKLNDPVEASSAPRAGGTPAEAQGEVVPLADRLAALASAERARDDRLVFVGANAPLLEVRDLSIRFPDAHGDVDVVDHVNFTVRPGETMGLVGESGCGKSITSMAIMGLLPKTAQLSGQVLFDGTDLLALSPKEHNALRGHEIAMIYQDALSSLNPSMLIKAQMKQLTSRGGRRSAEELLELVGLDPTRTLNSYPHELSGGQRQRVLIAMALTRNPRLVIADEPTTALDVTVQKQVIELLNDLREKLGFAMVFVSHDLALVAQVAHKITVMYAGQVVESGETFDLLTDPRHEYTRGLLGSVLSIEAGTGRLHQVPGVVPSPREFVSGDRFAPRSSHPDVGLDVRPDLVTVPGTSHRYAAHPELEDVR